VLTSCEYDENAFQTGYFALAAEKSSSTWIIDSGASHHMYNGPQNHFRSYSRLSQPINIKLGDNTVIQATHKGIIQVQNHWIKALHCWKKLLGAECTALSVRRAAYGVRGRAGGVDREANVRGAKAGSVGMKRGSSERYLVFSVWWFFFCTRTTLYIATIIVAD
jgi:hypothetical protein